MGYSIGIGLTNDCNLRCAHCYRDVERVDAISLAQIRQLSAAVPVARLGMGTGENGLHPEFEAIVRYLHGLGVVLSMASNGYSLVQMPAEVLQMFHDVEVSIDYASQAEQDALRGPGNWELVHQALARCQGLGVEVSVLATMMRSNFDQMDCLVALARRNGANLRVNVYQPVKSDAFRLSYEQFWEGYRRLFSAGLVVACSEPVVRAAMGLAAAGSPCGSGSIRINPLGQVIPCVYWPVAADAPRIADLARGAGDVLNGGAFEAARRVPPAATACPCGGGCASRRALGGELDAHDPYCPWARGNEIQLAWRPAPAKDLMRMGNVCTTVVI